MTDGFINLLKPPGISSGAAVGIVKRLTGERVGHAGTLDPEACGVLPLMVGRATRLFDFLVEKEKTYLTEIAFGCATDTQDAQGRVTERSENWPSRAQVVAALPAFTGDIWQRPPAFSALKRGGEPLYRLARRGQARELEPRRIHIARIEALSETASHGLLLRVTCGRGTYIRTLCHDLGQAVGCPAHMRFLLREQTGAFTLETAVTLEEIRELCGQAALAQRLWPSDRPLAHLPRIDVPDALAKKCLNGVPLPLDAPVPESPSRLYVRGAFAGIWQAEGGKMTPRVVFGAQKGSTQE